MLVWSRSKYLGHATVEAIDMDVDATIVGDTGSSTSVALLVVYVTIDIAIREEVIFT